MSRRAWFLFLTLGVIWGIPYLLIKYAIVSFSPVALVFARTALGGLVLLPLALRRRGFDGLWRHWRPLLAYTAFEIAIPWVALTHAEEVVSSGLAALLIAFVPVVGFVIALATKRSARLGPGGLAGLGLGLAGVAMLVGREVVVPSGPGSTRALLEMALVVLGYALGPVVIDRYLSHLPSSGVIVSSLLIVAVVFAPLGIAQWPRDAQPSALIAVALLGVLCTAAAFVALFALVREVGPVRATVITYINPAVAIVAGVLLLGEAVTVWTIAGFLAIVAGSFLVQRRPGSPEPAAVTT